MDNKVGCVPSKTFVITVLVAIAMGYCFGFVWICYGARDSIRHHRPIRSAKAGSFQHTDKLKTPMLASEQETLTMAERLAKKVRILCWVLTFPTNHRTKADNVKATWGRRCNTLLFMSSTNDTTLPTVVLPVREGRKYLWSKTKEALRYVHKHYRDSADWFFKADDDTYAIIENLRYMLAYYKTTDLLYFGHTLTTRESKNYMHGGPGYVLSAAALDLFAKEGLNSPDKCNEAEEGDEDVNLGICLHNLGVSSLNSKDKQYRDRFFPGNIEHVLSRENQTTVVGYQCCSKYAVSFHYVQPRDMILFDFLVYRLRVYGVNKKHPGIVKISNITESIYKRRRNHDHSLNRSPNGTKPSIDIKEGLRSSKKKITRTSK